jgi:hypothetical protein
MSIASTTDYNVIEQLAKADANNLHQLSDAPILMYYNMSEQWTTLETWSRQHGWDIISVVRDFAAPRVCMQKLRGYLMLCLDDNMRAIRTPQYERGFLEERGRTYGDSWKKRGGVGAFMMLARKWDRIENISGDSDYGLETALRNNIGNIVDDVDDLRRYLLLVESEVV